MPHVEVPQAEFKLVILGDANCGKTSLITRFTQGYYRYNSPKSSIHHPTFVTKSIPVTSSNIPTKIQIWDVAGPTNTNNNSNTTAQANNKGAHTAAKCYYSTSSAILLGYDVTSRSSYEGMRLWLNELRKSVPFHVVVVAIVALKTDLLPKYNPTMIVEQKQEVIPEYEVEQLAQALNVMYVPTSSKLDVNVTSLFQRVAEEVLERRKRGMVVGQQTYGLGVGMNERYHSSVNTDILRPSSPFSSKDLYGNDNNNKNSSHMIGNGSNTDVNHDHRDDNNTSSSMMPPNDNMMMNGNNDNDYTSSTPSNMKNSNHKRSRSSKSISSSSNAEGGCTPGAMMNLATGACSENDAGGIPDVHHGDYHEDDSITLNVGDKNVRRSNKSGGKDNNGENDGSFLMMCGGDTWCGKTSDTID